MASISDLAHTKINRRQHHKQINQTAEQVFVNNDRNLQDHFINHSENRNIHFIIKFVFELNCFLNDEKI